MSRDTKDNILFGLLFAVLVAIGIWFAAFAPCWVYSWSPHHEVPARCLAEFIR